MPANRITQTLARSVTLLLAALLAGGGAAVLVVLSARADASRRAQLSLSHVQDAFNGLGSGALAGSNTLISGGNSKAAGQHYTESVNAALNNLQPRIATLRKLPMVPGIPQLEASLHAAVSMQQAGIVNLRLHPNSIAESLHGHLSAYSMALWQKLSAATAAAEEGFANVNAAYSSRADTTRTEEIAGVSIVITLLLLAFAFFFRRSSHLNAQVEGLLAKSRREALTDKLTGLPNRRALDRDLQTWVPELGTDEQLIIAIYDLNGFKNYNDTFGHPAGDALLSRLGTNIERAMGGIGKAYRMGGDEFCLLVRRPIGCDGDFPAQGAEALRESGENFCISAAFGACRMPSEADNSTDALRLADQRLYQHKREGRSSAGSEVTAALVTALAEHGSHLEQQTTEVSELARMTAEELGLNTDEITRISTAAKLYDIGKLALPDSLLTKTEPLAPEDRSFLRRHPLVGARIVTAAPSLAPLAPLVRSSHENFDGSGFPEGLSGDQIPVGARVIAICDAYFHSPHLSDGDAAAGAADAALAELRKRAGRSFDPQVLQAFAAAIARRSALLVA